MPESIGFLILAATGLTEIAGFAVTAEQAKIIGGSPVYPSVALSSLQLNPAKQIGERPARDADAAHNFPE
jgi:hypothetical protein